VLPVGGIMKCNGPLSYSPVNTVFQIISARCHSSYYKCPTVGWMVNFITVGENVCVMMEH